MNTRLKQFLAAENISQAQFADSINVVRASVSHVLAGRNNPSYDFIKAIMDNYPQLNIEWLILGKGKMYKDKMSAPMQEAAPKDDLEPGLLFAAFHEDSEESAPLEPDIPLLVDDTLPNIEFVFCILSDNYGKTKTVLNYIRTTAEVALPDYIGIDALDLCKMGMETADSSKYNDRTLFFYDSHCSFAFKLESDVLLSNTTVYVIPYTDSWVRPW